MSYVQADIYDYPRYYDVVFDQDTDAESRFLELLACRHGPRRGRRVLEPACGTGRVLRALHSRGWRVTGFDANEAMVRFARGRLAPVGARQAVHVARMESFAAPHRFELACCLLSSFRYLLSERAARMHLRHVARALVPGGLYVIGIDLTDYSRKGCQHERWTGRAGRTSVTWNLHCWPPQREGRRERLRARLDVLGRSERQRWESSWCFRTYDDEELRRTVAAIHELELVATYVGSHGPARQASELEVRLDRVLVLRKRRTTP